jgi:lysophospholipase L1-like esterase
VIALASATAQQAVDDLAQILRRRIETGSSAAVIVAIRPQTVTLNPGQTQQFAAVLAGPSNTGVTWSLREANGGAIEGSGMYSAPIDAGTYHVVVTSAADAAASDTATINVVLGGGPLRPLPLISRGVPVFSSGDSLPATNANDADYGTLWRSSGIPPVWIAYDLSGVPAAQRARAVVAWYSDNWNYNYDHAGDTRYDCPGLYTIDAHAAPGGGSPPAESDPAWVKLAEVTSLNPYNGRQHVVSLTAGGTVHNWIRMRVTQVNGSDWNYDVVLNLDIHDAHEGLEDDWIFFGDSITAGAMAHAPRGDLTFSQTVQLSQPGFFPVQQDGGVGGWGTMDGILHIPAWLADFPGRYVGIAFGTNDTWQMPSQFYANYETIVRAVMAAGKIPVIPTIPWNRSGNAGQIPPLNAKLDQLKTAYPEIISGPDFWTFFQTNQALISSDNIHPTDAGYVAYRRLWAETMLTRVYPKRATAGRR